MISGIQKPKNFPTRAVRYKQAKKISTQKKKRGKGKFGKKGQLKESRENATIFRQHHQILQTSVVLLPNTDKKKIEKKAKKGRAFVHLGAPTTPSPPRVRPPPKKKTVNVYIYIYARASPVTDLESRFSGGATVLSTPSPSSLCDSFGIDGGRRRGDRPEPRLERAAGGGRRRIGPDLSGDGVLERRPQCEVPDPAVGPAVPRLLPVAPAPARC